jgi:hypothetical protein
MPLRYGTGGGLFKYGALVIACRDVPSGCHGLLQDRILYLCCIRAVAVNFGAYTP